MNPPRLPLLVLRWSRGDGLADVEGDLQELFEARVRDSGIWTARLRYWHDVTSILLRAHQVRRFQRSTRKAISMRIRFQIMNEIRFAARALAKRPGYAAVAAFTLALGLGSNVAIFAVLNAVLLRQLPYPDADRLVDIRHHAPGLGLPDTRSSPGLTVHYGRHARSLMHVAAYDVRQLNLSGSDTPERVRAIAASPELFDALASRPALGRGFTHDDAQPNAARVALLTHALWQSRFGGDAGVIGRAIRLDGQSTEVIGVMPRGFAFPDPEVRIYVPRHLDESAFGQFGVTTVARLAPNATLEEARREIDQLQQRLPEWFSDVTPDLLGRFQWAVSVTPLRERLVANVSRQLWVVFGTVGLLLLIACTNVANLFLVRAESRHREVAVRTALGAGRGRIAMTFLAESLVLAALGGLGGLLVAEAATRLLVAFGPARLPRLHEVDVDGAVVGFALVLTVGAAAVLGVLPAVNSRPRSFATVLRDGGRGTTAGRARHRTRQSLIVVQVAMAVVLLIVSGLTLQSVARLSAVDTGMRVEGLVTTSISIGAGVPRESAVATYDRVLEELAALPGVASVGGATTMPVAAGSVSGSSLEMRSRPQTEQAVPQLTMYTAISAGYFETLGVRLIEGRFPEPADIAQRRPVAWINQALAKQYFGGRALGESIRIREDAWLEIVGVVGDLRTFGLEQDPRAMAYVPLGNPIERLDVLHAAIRTAGDPAQLAAPIRRAVDRVDATLPVTAIRTMQDVVDASLSQTTFTVTLLAIAAGVALLLGIVGLYGVISYIVTQRTNEIGVRLALGARPLGVCGMVLRQGLIVASLGVFAGLAAAAASTRLMSSLLFGVSERDPLTFALVAVILFVVSMMATYIPARRAARVDPLTALRDDG